MPPPTQPLLQVTVTEVADASEFFVQVRVQERGRERQRREVQRERQKRRCVWAPDDGSASSLRGFGQCCSSSSSSSSFEGPRAATPPHQAPSPAPIFPSSPLLPGPPSHPASPPTHATNLPLALSQVVGEPRVSWLAEQLSAASLTDAPPIPPELKVGQLCLAQYRWGGRGGGRGRGMCPGPKDKFPTSNHY